MIVDVNYQHVVRLEYGGSNNVDNLVALCKIAGIFEIYNLYKKIRMDDFLKNNSLLLLININNIT